MIGGSRTHPICEGQIAARFRWWWRVVAAPHHVDRKSVLIFFRHDDAAGRDVDLGVGVLNRFDRADHGNDIFREDSALVVAVRAVLRTPAAEEAERGDEGEEREPAGA